MWLASQQRGSYTGSHGMVELRSAKLRAENGDWICCEACWCTSNTRHTHSSGTPCQDAVCTADRSRRSPTHYPGRRSGISIVLSGNVRLISSQYTSDAFQARTSLTCASLSFKDIAEGALPEPSVKESTGQSRVSEIKVGLTPTLVVKHPSGSLTDPFVEAPTQNSGLNQSDAKADPSTPGALATASASTFSTWSTRAVSIEMVICSFALHLIETPSELFALLWELRCALSNFPQLRDLTKSQT